MQRIDEEQLRNILGKYRVAPLRVELVAQTKRLMREEMLCHSPAPETGQAGMVLMLAMLALLICFNMFYVATVGTILKFVLPASLELFLNHSILGVSVAGVSIMSGFVFLIYFKNFGKQRALSFNTLS